MAFPPNAPAPAAPPPASAPAAAPVEPQNDDAMDALMAASGDAELGPALAGEWQEITLTRNDDGTITVDVDGVSADVDMSGDDDSQPAS